MVEGIAKVGGDVDSMWHNLEAGEKIKSGDEVRVCGSWTVVDYFYDGMKINTTVKGVDFAYRRCEPELGEDS